MGRVVVRRASDLEWGYGAGREIEIDGKRQWGIRGKGYFDPERDGVSMRHVEYAPGYTEPSHSHSADEIIYILRGRVEIGDDEYGRGDALFIEAGTPYGPLQAGNEGLEFLLIRHTAAEYIPAQNSSAPVGGGV